MPIDMFQSRRGYYEKCCWWSRKITDNVDNDDLVIKRVPSGYFMAKEVNQVVSSNNQMGGAFIMENVAVTLKTPDNIMGIKENDVILYQDDKWRVDSVSRQIVRRQSNEFTSNKNISYYWYVSIRK